MSVATDNTIRVLKSQSPGAPLLLIQQTLFETVGEFARDVLQVEPPTDYKSDMGTWLTEAQWVEHHTTIIAGTFARLYSMPGKPWTDTAAAAANAGYYTAMMPRAREVAANSTLANSSYLRLMSVLRSAFPAIRDPGLSQEVFNTVDEFTRNVLQIAPPTQNTPADQWLATAQWDNFYRVILAGAMVRLLAQPGKPWTDLKAAGVYQAQWSDLCVLARADANDVGSQDPTFRLIANLRDALTGSKDSQIKQQLFNVVMDACKRGYLWVETVPFKLDIGRQAFNIVPEGADIVMVSGFTHATLSNSEITYGNGNVYISKDIANLDLTDFLYITMALQPTVFVDVNNPSSWLPYDVWSRKFNLLLNGTLAMMMLQSAKPFSNRELGTLHARLYARELTISPLVDRDRGLPTKQHWTFPRFA